MAAQRMRTEGNDFFSRGDYLQAVEKYSAYIECVADEDGPSKNSDLLFGYSNRAQGYLKLERYAKALEDAEKALRLDSSHLKSWLRKTKALEGLKFHQEVLNFSRQVLRNYKKRMHGSHAKEFQLSLEAAERKDRQTRLGRFEDGIDTFWDLSTGIPVPPSMEEYVGPVEIKRVDGMGRGVFATRDLAPGELLFVSNSLVTIRIPVESMDSHEESNAKSAKKLLQALKRCVRHAELDKLEDLSQLQFLVQIDALGGPYPTEPMIRDCPPMRYFSPVNGLPPQERKILDQDYKHPTLRTNFDDEMLRKIVERRQFSHWATNNDELNGIYALPSLMNHSCIPNVAVTTMQNATVTKMYRAGKKIKKGEELFYAYFNIYCPLDARRAYYPSLGCRCERCENEETVLLEVQHLKSLSVQCNKFWQDRPKYVHLSQRERSKKRNQCLICLNLLESLLECNSTFASLTEIEKDWIRASFVRFNRLLLDPALALAVASCTREDLVHDIKLVSVAVKAMNTVQPGSDMALAMISGLCNRVGRTRFSQEVELSLSDLHTLGIEIIRTLNGSCLKEETVRKLFSYSSLMLTGSF
ncbi:hypothetical protein R1flu_000470 [Riccia fluitans]|uniref:SET domain-containing protein n=1 Tax=Riccia fluitans TaxID=41844 RepID=A0ABD1Y0J1_9MARC